VNENEKPDRHTLPLFDPDITMSAGDQPGTSGDDMGAEPASEPGRVKRDEVRQEKDLLSDI